MVIGIICVLIALLLPAVQSALGYGFSRRSKAQWPFASRRLSRGTEQEKTDKGQDTLTPEEFGEKYGWENNPGKVSMQ